ncbi:MAG TPA: glycosyltransferase [Polyangiaceae bacterium]|nr:glycosyltransferase [Polyangiaceae bacterium]
MNSAQAAEQLFVVPDLGGRPTGGTLYNRRLLGALSQLGFTARWCELERAEFALREEQPRIVWLDSLYLAGVPALKARLSGSARLGLLLHYLPALVAQGRRVEASELSVAERAALSLADCALVPSEFMREVVSGLGFGDRPILCVEPGCELLPGTPAAARAEGVRALLVAHVVAGKGIEPLLAALAVALGPSDRFELCIVGDLSVEPSYAARCQALVAAEPMLVGRVRFRGLLSERDAHAALFASNLLLSASFMESYGMALAEGRAAGLPLLVRDGGNVRFHIEPAAGGECVASATELAQACVRLCRDPGEHERRLLAARNHAGPARPWRRAAEEFVAAIQPLFT